MPCPVRFVSPEARTIEVLPEDAPAVVTLPKRQRIWAPASNNPAPVSITSVPPSVGLKAGNTSEMVGSGK